jgi:hypothetical protein
MHHCDKCREPLFGAPWVVFTRGGYAFACTPQCKQAIQREEERVAIAQRAMSFGHRVFDGR